MPRIQVDVRNGDRPELDAFLGDRLYEFNSTTTGIYDGELLNASVEDETGNIVAAMTGYTWGGCCEIVRVWVRRAMRGTGVGTALMEAAEREAVLRGCHQIVLSTHSFQALRFYEDLGFHRLAAIPDYPRGHEKITYVKHLPPGSRA